MKRRGVQRLKCPRCKQMVPIDRWPRYELRDGVAVDMSGVPRSLRVRVGARSVTVPSAHLRAVAGSPPLPRELRAELVELLARMVVKALRESRNRPVASGDTPITVVPPSGSEAPAALATSASRPGPKISVARSAPALYAWVIVLSSLGTRGTTYTVG
jgi:hypothetical protein